MLSIVAALVVAQASPPPDICRNRMSRWRICETSSAGSAASYAYFELAPADGAGMGSACACAAITGAKGETVTVTRGSNATCTKGDFDDGIADGDLVICGNNLPRVSTGGTGSLGILREAGRTNTALRSQELDNTTVWTDFTGGGAAAPTRTANAATAPDGTATADRLQFAATNTASSQVSAVYQATGCTGVGTAVSRSFYVKGVSGSGTIAYYAGSGSVVTCNYVSSSWTRCRQENNTTSSGFAIGNISSGGNPSRLANDVYVWGAQCEVGASITSYIPTVGSSVARSSDIITASIAGGTEGSMAVSFTPNSAIIYANSATACGILANSVAGPSYRQVGQYRVSDSALRTFSSGAGGSVASRTYTPVKDTEARLVSWWNASNVASIVDGNSATGSPYSYNSTTLLEIGNYDGANPCTGLYKKICMSTSSTECR